jgi:deazaflavin-dependent oxidoreductase (nitroreductase family)
LAEDGQYLRIETKGRKTGRPHDVLVRYVMYGGKLVVFPQNGTGQDWVKNIIADPTVRVFGRGVSWEGRARMVLARDLKDPIFGAFQRKYGEAEVRRRYWGQRTYAEIEVSSQRKEDVNELVYADLEVAFDGVAETYDSHILGNPMNLWLRNRSVALLTRLFRPGDTVLEIGCGTGTETLQLAKSGIRVLATDISSRMLDVMMKKAKGEGLDQLVVPIHCRPYELRARVAEAGYPSVDGAYSTYGAVNTEPRMGEMMENLHAMIKEGGKLVLGVWNKFCLYEIAGYASRGRPAMMVARLRNPVPVGKSRFCVSTNAFSVGELDRMVGRWFAPEEVLGVEIFLPPSNLVRYLPPRPLAGLARSMDKALESHFPWNRLGDHFLRVYTRV